MNLETIAKYDINFQNKVRDNGVVKKLPNSKLGYLDLFLFECKTSDIDDDEAGLLIEIDNALGNSNSEIESGSGIVDIIIYQDVVKFYVNGDDNIYYMPTVDFREIIVGWRGFLLTPPLNGTKARTFPTGATMQRWLGYLKGWARK